MDISHINPERLDVAIMQMWREGHRDFTFLQHDSPDWAKRYPPTHVLATHFEEGLNAEEAYRQARAFRETVITRVYTGDPIPFAILPR